jgi:transposase
MVSFRVALMLEKDWQILFRHVPQHAFLPPSKPTSAPDPESALRQLLAAAPTHLAAHDKRGWLAEHPAQPSSEPWRRPIIEIPSERNHDCILRELARLVLRAPHSGEPSARSRDRPSGKPRRSLTRSKSNGSGNPRHFTPKHVSWLNQIECWFSILGRHVLSRGSFTSTDDLTAKIDSYVAWYLATDHPSGGRIGPSRGLDLDVDLVVNVNLDGDDDVDGDVPR